MSSASVPDDAEESPSSRLPRRNLRGNLGLTRDYAEASSEEDEDAGWSPSRRILHKILCSTGADVVLGGVIAFSLAVVIAETDATVDGDEPPESIQIMNIGFTLLYAFELIVRLYVYRCPFFYHWFNVSTLRIFRLAKLARVLVLLEKFPELHMILSGIYCTIKSIFWGMCLLVIIIIIWSILGAQLIHPLSKDIDYGDCERCNRAFAGVFNSFLTIFQTVVAGDSWGQLAVPIVEHHPLALAYFSAVFVSIGLMVLNLILATTVERAADAKREDEAELNHLRLKAKKKAYLVSGKRLKTLCKEMDVDGSGALTLEELENGYKTHPEFRKEMEVMDIREDDMKTVFKLLDLDDSGDVNYEEFVESLHMLKTRDSHTMLMFTYHLVEDIVSKSTSQLRMLTSEMDGLARRVSDEVTSKAISAWGPLLEKLATSKQPYELWPHDMKDDEAPVASWSSMVLTPMEESGKQEQQKPEKGRVLASALDVVPPIAPVTPLTEALGDKDGRGIKVTTGTASFAACCQRSTEVNIDEAQRHSLSTMHSREPEMLVINRAGD